ncbi:MAG: hypothetical protein D6752_01195, partial [Candidatus Nitrosothermus koennekii]
TRNRLDAHFSKLLSGLDYVMLVIYEVIGDELNLIVIHNNNDKTKAVREINDRLSRLKSRRFKHVYLAIYHISEFD